MRILHGSFIPFYTHTHKSPLAGVLDLYDTLLEDEDSTRTRVSSGNFSSVVEAGAESPATPTEEVDRAAAAKPAPASGLEETDAWSDDPVRMYLTQMGEIPLLTRKEEIDLAKRIEDTRREFRTKLLECDYVIRVAYKTLVRVHRCLLYTSPSPRDRQKSRMPSSA